VGVLVSLAALKTHLGDAPTSGDDDELLEQLIDDVEALFASETGRALSSYRAATTASIEVHDGTGSADLYLDYPITVLTSVKLGYDAAVPDETLTIADKNVIVYAAGARRITRTDGGCFGRAGQPRYIQVVYDAAADLPGNASLAIKSVTATAYRRRGSEDVKSETAGSFYSHTLVDDIATADPFWTMAVSANRRTVLV
jgi:hypothetical protein